MKVTYNPKKKTFTLIFLDPIKVVKGDKYPYTRKQESWSGVIPPNKRQQNEVKNRLLAFAHEQIKAAQKEADTLAVVEEVKGAMKKAETLGENESLPVVAVRKLFRKAVCETLERINWENVINWPELYHEFDKYLKERLQNENEEGEQEI